MAVQIIRNDKGEPQYAVVPTANMKNLLTQKMIGKMCPTLPQNPMM